MLSTMIEATTTMPDDVNLVEKPPAINDPASSF
jgi:hypothetical protein